MTQLAVQARNVSKDFTGRSIIADLDLEIRPGEFVALLGRSGAGKSTLLRIFGGLDPDYDGDVLVPRRRAVVFQEPRLIPWQRVLPNVALGLKPTADIKRQSEAALGEVGLADHA